MIKFSKEEIDGKEDIQNNQFFDFLDMIGQQFDGIWAYTTAMSKITDRQNDLSKGFSKDLIFNLSKALGFDVQDGKDLLELSRVGFGQKASGSAYSLYTSGSLSSPAEGDISKEITKRIVASMPYLLKSKGTIGSLKGLMNCYNYLLKAFLHQINQDFCHIQKKRLLHFDQIVAYALVLTKMLIKI